MLKTNIFSVINIYLDLKFYNLHLPGVKLTNMKKNFYMANVALILMCLLLFYNSSVAQNVGIGVPEPSEKLEVAGNTKASDFIYATPKTSFYAISGSDFIPVKSTDTVLFNIGSGGVTMENSVAAKSIVAPVHLPDGATMINMTAYMYDASVTDNLQVVFYRKTITSNFFPDNIGDVASSGSAAVTTSYQTPVNSFSNSNIVDNSLYTYYLSVEPQSFNGIWQTDMELRAVIFSIHGSKNAVKIICQMWMYG